MDENKIIMEVDKIEIEITGQKIKAIVKFDTDVFAQFTGTGEWEEAIDEMLFVLPEKTFVFKELKK